MGHGAFGGFRGGHFGHAFAGRNFDHFGRGFARRDFGRFGRFYGGPVLGLGLGGLYGYGGAWPYCNWLYEGFNSCFGYGW